MKRVGAVAVLLCLVPASIRADGAAPPPFPPKGANLVAFIGRRIDVQSVKHKPKANEILFDSEYRARYEVLQVVYGTHAKTEISFSSFIHIGPLALKEYELGLVYVSKEDDGRYVQQKYLFQPVYPTEDGRWAGCGDPYKDLPEMHRHGVKAVPIVFKPPVRFDTKGMSAKNIAAKFPEPMFRHEAGAAVCVMGNYPEDLFRVMAEGYLKYRGVFGPPPR